MGAPEEQMMAKHNGSHIKKNVCEEAPVELVVNDLHIATFMCTPQNLDELAVGHLFSRGLISGIKDILVLGVCDELHKIIVRTKNKLPESNYGLEKVLHSGCGGGGFFTGDFGKYKQVDSVFSIPLEKLQSFTKEMFASAELYKTTGGVHCAAVADDSRLVICREDIGRHNAVDKVIGKGLFLELDFRHHVIICTGRISSDMILKAAAAGFPVVVSRSIPSTLALEIARRLNITVVGRIAGKYPIVYNSPQRILDSPRRITEQANTYPAEN